MVKLQALHLLLLLVVVTAACCWTVDGLSLEEGENKLLVSTTNPPTSSPNNTQQLTTEVSNDTSEGYEDFYEDYYELSESEELQDGMLPAKVQPVVKPRNEDRKKKGSKKTKSKGKKQRNGTKKKKDPCKTIYEDYCIHGKCQYLKDLNKPSCICLPGYQNERCGIQVLHTGTNEKRIDDLSIALVVVAVMLLIFILTAVTVAVTLQIRKKLKVKHDIVSEEKQKLRTENGIVV